MEGAEKEEDEEGGWAPLWTEEGNTCTPEAEFGLVMYLWHESI